MSDGTHSALIDLTTKIAALESLVLHLYGDTFRKASDPVAAIQGFAENYRQRMEAASVTTGLGPQIAFEEYLAAFFQTLARMMERELNPPPQ